MGFVFVWRKTGIARRPCRDTPCSRWASRPGTEPVATGQASRWALVASQLPRVTEKQPSHAVDESQKSLEPAVSPTACHP